MRIIIIVIINFFFPRYVVRRGEGEVRGGMGMERRGGRGVIFFFESIDDMEKENLHHV